MSAPERIEHPFQPVIDGDSRVLILGTMASPMSRKNGFYYGHPQNRFWRVLAAVLAEPVPEDNAARAALALRHGIALWDVLQSCDIAGASDATIQNPVPNDVASLVRGSKIEKICTTGAAATRLYRALSERDVGLPPVRLPSPSPANCAIPFEKLVEAYGVALAGSVF